jgi:hypothetical protein
MLKWSKANAKTAALSLVPSLAPYLANKRKIYSLDLLSGYSCPYAVECLSKAVVKNGKSTIKDGPFTQFRCFSATQENQYPNTYNSRKLNFDLLRSQSNSVDMFRLLDESMPANLGVCRIHVGGDMFNRHYMLAWGMMAEKHPDRLFYAYTKSLPFWVKYRDYIDSLPNLVFTASYGGRFDSLIESEGLRYAKVVFSEDEAKKLGLEIDHDDSHAADPSKKKNSFGLLIHGTQPAGSNAATALKELKGKGSYNRKKLSLV